MAQFESGYRVSLSTKTVLINSQADSLSNMRAREDTLYDKLSSISEEVKAIGVQNEKLRRRIEAMEDAKREASDHWDVKRTHLRKEVERAIVLASRTRGRAGEREEGEVGVTDHTSVATGLGRSQGAGLFAGTSSGEMGTPFSGAVRDSSRDDLEGAGISRRAASFRGGHGYNIPMFPKGGTRVQPAAGAQTQEGGTGP